MNSFGTRCLQESRRASARTRQNIVGRRAAGLAFDAETGRSIALRIKINDQHVLADRGERGTKIDRRRGFADPALLIGDRQNPRPRAASGRMASFPKGTTCGSTGCSVIGVSVMVDIPQALRLRLIRL